MTPSSEPDAAHNLKPVTLQGEFSKKLVTNTFFNLVGRSWSFVLAMLLTLSKRIIEADRRMRREDGLDRNAFIGTEAYGKTIGIVGLGHIGSRVAELTRGLVDLAFNAGVDEWAGRRRVSLRLKALRAAV